jgi:hypothetical protein
MGSQLRTFLFVALFLTGFRAPLSARDNDMTPDQWERSRGWYGSIPARPGDEEFSRIYVKNATLHHENGEEVALWGVNLQSAMSWEKNRVERSSSRKLSMEEWKKETELGFDELELMGCDVIRIHLCPGDFADAEGNLVETEWLDMLDYTMAECYRRGIYINLSLLNHLQKWGGVVEGAFFDRSLKEHKWELMVLPEMIRSSETYIRQLANRKNPYDQGRPYKHNPAWIIAEIINEPNWPKELPDAKEFPKGVTFFREWCKENGCPANEDSFSRFKYQKTKAYLDRMDRFLYQEKIPAVPCWNLYWSKGPLHQGKEGFDAAADSTMDVVSFSTYPGQDLSSKSKLLSKENMLPYLKESYKRRDWQGWLSEDRFRKHKARIVYEFEAWHNRSTYIYPAMAKYFRAQGAQVATMWTYTFNAHGPHMTKEASHNLSLAYTPRKAASFVVAGRLFKRLPRYGGFRTTAEDADDMKFCRFSLPQDLSAYADRDSFVHTDAVSKDFIPMPAAPKFITGYRSSPFVTYEGTGVYFLQQTGKTQWELRISPHFAWVNDEQSRLDSEKPLPIKLKLPGLHPGLSVYRLDGERQIKEEGSYSKGAISFIAEPGTYAIR